MFIRLQRLSCLLPLLASFLVNAPAFGQTNVLTYHNDNMRTGQNLSETVLTPQNVQSATFGKLMVLPVDGKVDAQPLLISGLTIPGKGAHNVLYAATEHDSLFALDADTGLTYWKVSLLKSGETSSDNRGCSQVSPEIGITSTPAIDLTAGPHGTIYAVAMSKDSTGVYHQRIHALDITSGSEQFGGPVDVQATYPGLGDNSSGGNVVFDPKQYKARPGLLISNGILYTSWGSHCDARPYTGWVMGYKETTLAQTSVFNFAPNGEGAAVWGAGGGIAADSAGALFFQLANGTFDTTLNASGFPGKADYGNAFIRLAAGSSAFSVVDYWTMFNTVSESNADEDLGSGGVLLIPDVVDSTGKTRHLGIGVGKDGDIYMFDRDNMGKFNPNNNSNLYQELASGLGGSEFASPAWFNGFVYFGAVGDVIRSFKMTAARLGASPLASSKTSFAFPGTTPSISANGTTNGILWAVENSNPAVLHAYDAANIATELYNSNQATSGRDQFGSGNKFITPMIANGKVYVGTPNSVAIFGLLGPTLTSITPASGTPGAAVSVTLAGTGFAAGSTVNVSGTGITVANVNVVSATQITAKLTIASNATAGPHNVTVTTASGTTNPVTFAVTAGATTTLTSLQCNVPLSSSNKPEMASLSSTSCTVTVSPAPGSAQSVSITSNSTYLTAPASVSVPAGATTASFTITSGSIPKGEAVTLTATAGATKTFAFTLYVALTSITCNPATVTHGTSTTCTLTFAQAQQGSTGAVLTSSSPSVTVPSSVLSAPNSTSATFNATVAANASPQQVTITAAREGFAKTFTITIQ